MVTDLVGTQRPVQVRFPSLQADPQVITKRLQPRFRFIRFVRNFRFFFRILLRLAKVLTGQAGEVVFGLGDLSQVDHLLQAGGCGTGIFAQEVVEVQFFIHGGLIFGQLYRLLVDPFLIRIVFLFGVFAQRGEHLELHFYRSRFFNLQGFAVFGAFDLIGGQGEFLAVFYRQVLLQVGLKGQGGFLTFLNRFGEVPQAFDVFKVNQPRLVQVRFRDFLPGALVFKAVLFCAKVRSPVVLNRVFLQARFLLQFPKSSPIQLQGLVFFQGFSPKRVKFLGHFFQLVSGKRIVQFGIFSRFFFCQVRFGKTFIRFQLFGHRNGKGAEVRGVLGILKVVQVTGG